MLRRRAIPRWGPGRSTLAAFVVAMTLSMPTRADVLDDALKASERGDDFTSLRLFLSLASDGNPVAQFNLGILYRKGRNAPPDPVEAAKWYRKAAEGGYAPAQYDLGLMYADGVGVAKDVTEALKWYGKAADQGLPHAQYNLGEMYFSGVGVTANFVQALKWFILAASGFSPNEADLRKVAEASRDEVASRMTPAQVAEAQKLAKDRMPKQ